LPFTTVACLTYCTRKAKWLHFLQVRNTRKKYGETIGQLQESLDRAIEDYLEMKDKFEREHDPNLPIQIESLEKTLEELRERNAVLQQQLDECEKTKLAEASKAQQLSDIVNQLSQSVHSLEQQVCNRKSYSPDFEGKNVNTYFKTYLIMRIAMI
jgi:hypothetical protein